MPKDAIIPQLPMRRPPPEQQTMPDFTKPDGPANVVPLKKPLPRKLSIPKPARPKVRVAKAPPQPALRLDFPAHRVRPPRAEPVREKIGDNVRTLLNTYWLDAFMRKVRLHLSTPQLMIEQEKRLLLVDYSRA